METRDERRTTDGVDVLLVEDVPGDAVLSVAALHAGEDGPGHHRVRTARSLAEALAAAADTRPDVVLLDLSLPDSQGLETLHRVRLGLPEVPIVVLSGHDDLVPPREAIATGAQDWLHKDRVDSYVLPRAVSWAIQRHRHVEQLRTAVAERDAANRELAEAAQLQTDFVAVASHELRTPVTVLAGFVQVLVDRWDVLSRDEVAELLAPLHRQSRRLVRLVTDLLTVSRLESGTFELVPSRIDLAVVLEEVARDALGGAGQTASEVVVDVPGPLYAYGDREMLGRLLLNIVDNALKHGRPPVSLWAVAHGEVVEVVVEDRGPGVDPTFVTSMFDRFTQAQDPRTRDVGGVGLGLSIAAGLADAMGGSLAHEPAVPHGARFRLTLPATAAQPTEPWRVLVVEDEEDLRTLAVTVLGADGELELELVASGEDALEAFRRFRPDVTIMDLQLPGRDGFDATALIREVDPEHPVILWSNHLDEFIRRRASDVGITSVVPKGDMVALREQVLRQPGRA